MPLHRTLIAAAIAACLLSACDRAPAPAGDTQTPPAAAAPASIADVELIQRDALFGNPDRANVQISPDGKYLSWIAAVMKGASPAWVAHSCSVCDRWPTSRVVTR